MSQNCCSFIGNRQRGIKIDINSADHSLNPLDKTDINGLQALRMVGNITSKEAQELTKDRVIAFVRSARVSTTSPPGRTCNEAFALAQSEGASHGFRHCGLIAVGEGGIDFEPGCHGKSSVSEIDMMHGNAIALPCQFTDLPTVKSGYFSMPAFLSAACRENAVSAAPPIAALLLWDYPFMRMFWRHWAG